MAENHNEKPLIKTVYVPCWLAQIPESKLSSNAKALYARLYERAYNSRVFEDSIKEYSKILIFTDEEIEKGINELSSVGLIQKYYEGHKISYYKFLSHYWMDEPINENYNYETFHYVTDK